MRKMSQKRVQVCKQKVKKKMALKKTSTNLTPKSDQFKTASVDKTTDLSPKICEVIERKNVKRLKNEKLSEGNSVERTQKGGKTSKKKIAKRNGQPLSKSGKSLDKTTVRDQTTEHKLNNTFGSPKKRKQKGTVRNRVGAGERAVRSANVLPATARLLSTGCLSSEFSWDATCPPTFRRERHASGDSDSDDDGVGDVSSSSGLANPSTSATSSSGGGGRQRVATATAEQERRLYQLERERLETGVLLATTDDHERLVVAQPDDAAAWIRYMAHHLQAAEVDRARAVARRALRTIGYRRDADKLNVYVAWLNLETLHGSEDSLAAVLHEAEAACDSAQLCLRMAEVYAAGGRPERAEAMLCRLARRHAHAPATWLQYALFLSGAGRAADMRALLPRALRALDQRHHVEVISKFGQLEFRAGGDPERGRTVFDQLLAAHPRRLDQWLVYVAQLRRVGDTDGARQVFERLAGQPLDVRRARSVYKQWLAFEQQHGSEQHQSRVRRLAQKYVDAELTTGS